MGGWICPCEGARTHARVRVRPRARVPACPLVCALCARTLVLAVAVVAAAATTPAVASGEVVPAVATAVATTPLAFLNTAATVVAGRKTIVVVLPVRE